MLRVPANTTQDLIKADQSDLTSALHTTLANLSEVEARYESDRECLTEWPGPDAAKERLLDLLVARHAREREPIVQLLAELHQQITMAAMFRNLHSAH